MKSLLIKTRELEYSELLLLNGGYSGGSGGGGGSKSSGSGSGKSGGGSSHSSGNGYGSGSGGGGRSKSKGSSKSSSKSSKSGYGGLSGGLYHLNDERCYIIGSDVYSSTTGWHSGAAVNTGTDGQNGTDTQNPDTQTPAGQQPAGGNNGPDAKPETAEKNSYEVDSIPEDTSKLGNMLNSFLSGLGKLGHALMGDAGLRNSVINQINTDMKNGNIQYEKGGFMCDDYVQQVLTKCGVDVNSYFAGAAEDKTCAQHISNLDKGGAYDLSVVDGPGVYVCFMADGYQKGEPVGEHCALMIATENGGYYIVDNSSGNNNSQGGLGIVYGASAQEAQSHFCYNSYYYQKVE